MSEYSTEWDFASAERWGEAFRFYPSGVVVQLSRTGSGSWVVDTYPSAAAAEQGEWDVRAPLAGALYLSAEGAAAAADRVQAAQFA